MSIWLLIFPIFSVFILRWKHRKSKKILLLIWFGLVMLPFLIFTAILLFATLLTHGDCTMGLFEGSTVPCDSKEAMLDALAWGVIGAMIPAALNFIITTVALAVVFARRNKPVN